MENPSRILYAIFAALLVVICLLLSRRYPQYNSAFIAGAWLFGLIMLIILWLLTVDSYRGIIDSKTDFAESFAKLDDEGRVAFGHHFPSTSYQMKRGIPKPHFEKTNVPIDDNEYIQKFLMDSDKDYIAPRRNWQTKDRPAWVWDEIVSWGIEHNKIKEDSYAGSHSWRWVGNSYMVMMAYWRTDRNVQDLSEMETA